ncbi:MAG TPA: B12-binding domain-containing radical SAM protein, partial [Clostridiaceae bacterium]|nr:B12-binding domain-containing radical SAM protein [Clostridiaceae bacterium]
MRTVLVALNSKYIHSSLAPWYLKAACGDGCGEIIVLEYTINDDIENVLGEIYSLKPDVAAFSCYIWNIGKALRLSENLKKVLPSVKIVLGGPEVSFDAEKIMEENQFIDYIITGEGEAAFKSLLTALKDLKDEPEKSLLSSIGSLVYRFDGNIFSNNPCELIKDLDQIPSPYTGEMLASTSDKVVYFESSRGCPFSCSYCLSSTIDGVRHFSLDRVKSELFKLIKAGVKLVKFVDRTFNCNKARAKEIFKFVIEHGENTAFHFEAAADLFDDEMIEMLSQAPSGRIQFEIGIQSTNMQTLAAVNRKSNLDRVFDNVRKLRQHGNIHLHLDLIAGLPYEDFCSFKTSFDAVYSLKPHNLQLGFLKMLKGSKIRREAYKYSYNYRSYPPYEVLGN